MTEPRRAFHEELDELRHDVVRAAAIVTDAIPRGTHVLLEGDLEAAATIVAGDDELDALSIAIEERAFHLLALQQPMASDLRALIGAIKISGELERSGDLVVNQVKAARRIYGTTLTPRCRGLIERMSEECQRLMSLAIDAYVEGDASLAAALDDMDDRLDGLHRSFIQAIFEGHHDDELDLQTGVQLALCGRFYERIGDHAVNIGDRVQFMVTGWMPEHTGAARARARAEALLPHDDANGSDGTEAAP